MYMTSASSLPHWDTMLPSRRSDKGTHQYSSAIKVYVSIASGARYNVRLDFSAKKNDSTHRRSLIPGATGTASHSHTRTS